MVVVVVVLVVVVVVIVVVDVVVVVAVVLKQKDANNYLFRNGLAPRKKYAGIRIGPLLSLDPGPSTQLRTQNAK